MVLDIISAAIIFVWAVFGYRKGFIKQAFTLAGILLAMFFSAPLAGIIEHILHDEFNISLTGRHLQAMLLTATAAVIYIVSFFLGHFLHNTLVKGINLAEKTNHILGAVLSITEAAIAIYFIFGVTAAYQNKVEKYAPESHSILDESTVFTVVKNNNLMLKYNFFKRDNDTTDSAPKQEMEKS